MLPITPLEEDNQKLNIGNLPDSLPRVSSIVFFVLFFFFSFFFPPLFMAAPAAYELPRLRGQIGAAAASLRHSHINTGSKLYL